jgi:hypothetical protein
LYSKGKQLKSKTQLSKNKLYVFNVISLPVKLIIFHQ